MTVMTTLIYASEENGCSSNRRSHSRNPEDDVEMTEACDGQNGPTSFQKKHMKLRRCGPFDKFVPKDPVSRIDGLLCKVNEYFAQSRQGLPAEARRLQQCHQARDVLKGLDLLVRDHVLDDYLLDHPVCLAMVRSILASRYPYLLRPDLRSDHDGDTAMADGLELPAENKRVFVPRIRPLSQAFTETDEVIMTKQVTSWVADYSTNPVQGTGQLVPAGIVNSCLDAYSKFEPVSSWADWANNYQDEQASTAELDIVQRIYDLERSIQPPSAEEMTEVIKVMPADVRQMLYQDLPDAFIIADLSRKMKRNKIASQTKTNAGIELRLDFQCPKPVVDETMKQAQEAAADVSVDEPMGVSTVHEFGRQYYKGTTIPLPQVLLPWAKNFLADEDADRTVGWPEKFAELTEYFAHLQHHFAGQDWGRQLEDAVGMLKTHWIFENYFYGAPELMLDFPVNVWPKESKRLPRLPGPDVELRKQSEDQRDLMGPRWLLHTEVISSHDRQYGMPTDILDKVYLRHYRGDMRDFWKGTLPTPPDPFNLVHFENRHYEACMNVDMARTAKLLSGKKATFRYSPQCVVEMPNGILEAKRDSLESFARVRGGRRAALQQCLSMFDASANRRMCSPWRTLVLPAPRRKQKPDAGIIFPSIMVKDLPPEKEKRDPWAYTRAHQRYRTEQEKWAAWTREHALKMAWKRKLAGLSDGPLMELPKVWKGLYPPDMMDVEMKRRHELLRRCQIIGQSLKRAARRAPRPFIHELVKMVHAGMEGRDWSNLGLAFAAHELISGSADELALIRPTEAAWLEYICQPSANLTVEANRPVDKIGAILISRLMDMLQDVDPMSLFRDTNPRSMDELLRGLNLVCGGSVGRYRFTRADVTRLAPMLYSRGVLRIYREPNGGLQFARPEAKYHPEDLIVWPDHEAEAQEEGHEDGVWGAKSVTSFCSLKDVAVPASIDDFADYPDGMPRRNDVLSLEKYMENPTTEPRERGKTTNFFRCLCYRLGLSLRGLEKLHEQDLEIIKDPNVQGHNAGFLGTMLDIWEDDTKKRPNDPTRNLEKKGGAYRETLTYPDVVKMADPDSYQQEWASVEWPDEQAARDLVRRNLARELYENKTMIWPLQLPYDSRTQAYKVVNPQVRAEVNETGQDRSRQGVLFREPVWTFGHPSRKTAAHLFWDMNNWPLNTLSRDIRERVQKRGPKGQQQQQVKQPSEMPVEISFKEHAERRRVFMPGSTVFLTGDTPLQRKTIENRIRMRFETTRRKTKKRPWTERIADVLFGEQGKATDDDLVLPDIDPRWIPQSRPRPAKRPRLEGSVAPVAGCKAGITITTADNDFIRFEALHSARGKMMVDRLGIDATRGSVTYYVPAKTGDDIPVVVYCKPESEGSERC